MDKFTTHHGVAVVINRANIDTDQIIPKQFLKRVERTGFGEFLFFDWRFNPDGSLNPEFELNQPVAKGASILVAGKNFGSGSSREHAPWSLLDYGIRAVIAPSFGDIFYNNCTKNGLLPVRLSEDSIADLMSHIQALNADGKQVEMTVDLESQTVVLDGRNPLPFDVDPFRRHCLLNGLDDIGLTLQHVDAISKFEISRPTWLPCVA